MSCARRSRRSWEQQRSCAARRQWRRMSGCTRSRASCATRPSGSTTTSRISWTRPGSAATRSSRRPNGSSPPISSTRRSSAAAGGWRSTRWRSTWTRICLSSMSTRCWSSRPSCRSSTTRPSIRPVARPSTSAPRETVTKWCSRSTIAAPASPRTRWRSLASGFSVATASRPPPRAPASACGSPRPSWAPMAAGCRRPAAAPIKAQSFPFSCRIMRTPNNQRPPRMTEQQPPVVLVVDDEVQIRRFLRAGLELDGFVVQDAETGADALKSVTLQQPDLVILDLGLPDMDGGDVLERLRSWSTVPLIVLSVRSNEAEKVRLLESGADDYVVKPFGMAELLARAHAAMRRQVRAATGEPVVRAGPLTIDLAARVVTLNGSRVTLTPKEYRLLQLLAQHAGNVVTHQYLLKEVWGSPHMHDTHYLRIFVRKLRQKIEQDPTQPMILLTELGVGYRLAVPDNGQAVVAAAS